MSVRQDLSFVKGDSIEFTLKFDEGIESISNVIFAVKSNYKSSGYAIYVQYDGQSTDGAITTEDYNEYNCIIYPTTMASDSLPPANYVYEIKVTTEAIDQHGVVVPRVYTPVYGQFKLLPNVTVG